MSETVRAQHLLLGVLGALAEPCGPLACFGQQLRQLGKCRLASGPELVDGLVPQESAAMPLLDQCALSHCAGAQSVAVAHCFFHTGQYTREAYIMPAWLKSGVSQATMKRFTTRAKREGRGCGPLPLSPYRMPRSQL